LRKRGDTAHSKRSARLGRICAKYVAISFKTWALDNTNQYPMTVTTDNGGPPIQAQILPAMPPPHHQRPNPGYIYQLGAEHNLVPVSSFCLDYSRNSVIIASRLP
jgi:hypothetical protein